jgi:hypothetical protein
VTILGFSIPFLLSTYSSINLTTVSLDAKLVASLGMGIPAVISFLEIERAFGLKNRILGRGD